MIGLMFNMEAGPLGKIIRDTRLREAMGQQELAGKIGATTKSIGNIESGRTMTMKLKFCKPLSQVLNVPLGQIMTAMRKSAMQKSRESARQRKKKRVLGTVINQPEASPKSVHQ